MGAQHAAATRQFGFLLRCLLTIDTFTDEDHPAETRLPQQPQFAVLVPRGQFSFLCHMTRTCRSFWWL